MTSKHCDYHGTCKNKAYAEVYPPVTKDKDWGWSYLCRKHFKQEKQKYKKNPDWQYIILG